MNKLSCLKFFYGALLGLFFTIIYFQNLSIVNAEDVATSVTVGNSPPVITIGPSEVPASDATSPTNVGSTITFEITASDSNNENYYLAVCKGGTITPNNNAAPTCTGGSWCVSSSTASGEQASCDYVAEQADQESNNWYAFVCDYSSNSACSAYQQGGTSNGSPFKVNHPPVFSTISNDGSTSINVGATVTWSTNVGTSDTDADTTPDTVKLVVCKSTGISNGDCDGGASDRWCQSSSVSNNPSCSYGIVTPTAHGVINAYVYLFDNHNFGATGANQASNSSFTVNNMLPEISGISLNSGADITVSEGTTKPVVLGASISDSNGCLDLESIQSSLYRSNIGASACDTAPDSNDNQCYSLISCSVGGGDTCSGATDATVSYQCNAYLQYFSDPTTDDSKYPTQNWKNTFFVSDGTMVSTEIGTGVELNTLVAMDVTSAIAYGNLNVGQKNDPLDKTTTITATGNVGLDEDLSGTDMSDGQGHNILVDFQKYALSPGTAYAVGTTLSTSAKQAELNCLKTTSVGSPQTKDTYWGMEIPNGTIAGTYTGTNYIVAAIGETNSW